MTVHNPADSTRLSALYRGHAVLENERPAMTLPTSRGPDRTTPLQEVLMAPEADTAHSADAQRFIDPIILQARAVNEWAAIERNLASRRALRPKRSAAASRGWETRRGD